MTKLLLRHKAIDLRLKGESYNEIRKKTGVAKSTLSEWLRRHPLNEDQILGLKKRNEQKAERYILTTRQKREDKLKQFLNEERKKWLPFSDREKYIAGIFLYWGEGNKSQRSSVSLNNTDPQVIRFYLRWLKECLLVPEEKLKVQLHLYQDMNIEEEVSYWSGILGLGKDHFYKPYIKASKRVDVKQKGFGHGTCGIVYSKTEVKERLLMAIQAISEECDRQI